MRGRILVLVLLLAVTAAARAQTPQLVPPPSEPAPITPLRIQVVIARYKGDQRISSLPYTMSVNAQGPARAVAQIRMGADIPVAATSPAPSDGKTNPAISYDQVGTQIDCSVRPAANGRFVLDLSVSDKTVYAEGDGPPRLSSPSLMPTFRSFRSTNSVVLRDGESAQFAAATDRMTGEIMRVEVTLHVVK